MLESRTGGTDCLQILGDEKKRDINHKSENTHIRRKGEIISQI